MNTIRNGFLLLVATSMALTQSCKLSTIDPPCPRVTSINPTSARFDDTVTITGENFLPRSPQLYKVRIGDQIISPIDVPGATSMRFKVPKGAGSGALTVTLAGRTACSTNATAFIYRLTTTDLRQFATGFDRPSGMEVDANGNVIVADRDNHIIQQVNPLGTVTILAGQKDLPGGANVGENNVSALLAKFKSPEDVAIDKQGNIYVADYNNHCIRKISFISPQRTVTTAAGTINVPGDNDGPLLTAKFNGPTGVTVTDDSNVRVVEYGKHRLRYVNFLTSTVSTPINAPGLNFPNRVTYSDKRNPAFPILIADKTNKRILEVNINGTPSGSPILLPFFPNDLAVDETGNIFVLDSEGKKVYVVYKDNSVVEAIKSTIAFDFKAPVGLAIDTNKKIIYISDPGASNSIASAKYE